MEEPYICHCTVLYINRGRYYCLFNQKFGPLCKVMKYEDQRRLGQFLLELKIHMEKWNDKNTPHKLINKKLSQLSLAPTILHMLQDNQRLYMWVLTKTLQRGYM